jgi:hypothetical protein
MLLVAATSRKLADAVVSTLIEWPPVPTLRSRGCETIRGRGRPIGAESRGTTIPEENHIRNDHPPPCAIVSRWSANRR